MIKGLEHFREYLKNYSENFILVGGVASHLLLDEAGAGKVRPTNDLDIVLMIRPQADFVKAFMEYINLGGYEIRSRWKLS